MDIWSVRPIIVNRCKLLGYTGISGDKVSDYGEQNECIRRRSVKTLVSL